MILCLVTVIGLTLATGDKKNDSKARPQELLKTRQPD